MIFNCNAPFRGFGRLCACAATATFLLVGNTGCNMFRNMGTGTRLDAPRDRPPPSSGKKKRDMIVEVTTNANGEVTNVVFKRSSGSDPVDVYVANSIHESWPRVASMVTVAEVTYSMAEGFSQPKTLSSHPVP